ncbi:MAG: serine hydrolase domain-containing protein [Terriglobales bacterium]
MKQRCLIVLLLSGFVSLGASAPEITPTREQVTVENWDKGGALSHWVYTHISDVFPTATIHRAGSVVPLPVEPDERIGALNVSGEDEKAQTLDEYINNGAVDGCIVLHGGRIVYEKYPTIEPNERHLIYSVTKAFVATTLALLEDQEKIDLEKPVETYLPELKASAWAGVRLRDVADMRSGVEGAETGSDAYRDPAHKQFQLEATLGWQPRGAPQIPDAAKRGDLFGLLGACKRVSPPGEKWAYTSSNTAVLGEVISRVTDKSLADNISQLIWSRIGAEQDALLVENEKKFPVAHAGIACTLRDLARFGLAFTKSRAERGVIPEPVIERFYTSRGTKADEHGMLPLTYQWDLLTDKGEMAKGGWAGQLLYVNRDKDVVVAYFGTNLSADPPLEPLPCRLIAKAF